MQHAQTAAESASALGAGIDTESCPWCGQPITHEEFREIEERIKGEERKERTKLEAQLREQFQRQEALRGAKAESEIQRVREEAAAAIEEERRRTIEREAVARAEAKKLAEDQLREQMLAAQQEKLVAEEAAAAAERDKLEALNQERERSAEVLVEFEERIAQLQREQAAATAAVEEERVKAGEREAAIRAEVREAAQTEFKAELLSAQREKQAAEEAKTAAEREKLEVLGLERERTAQIVQQLRENIAQLQTEKAAAAVAAEEERKRASEQVTAVRLEASALAEEKMKLEQEELRRHYVEEMQRQREVLEKDKEASLNQEKANAFADRQKLESKLEELKRQVQGQTAVELGEGAEVDLHEMLRGEFHDDRIKRIDKGEPGADIWHDVVHQGELCGRIVYDSKNRKAWRNEYIEKLRGDQLSAEADHALLTTSVFPAGERQICTKDGVIIANPARAVVLVKILREQIIQAHRLRLSGEDRDSKATALYDFINSDRCEQLLRRSENLGGQLLELDVKEKQAHERVWERRGALLRSTEKATLEFRSELARILGA